MRCNYCEKAVLGASPITVPGVGPAHDVCYRSNLMSKHVFSGLNIGTLDEQQLNELSDIVLMEKNARLSKMGSSLDGFEIELF